MSCRQVRKKLTAYLDAELIASSRSSIEKHLFICRRCQALLKTLSLSRTYLAKLKNAPYRDFIFDRERVFSMAPLRSVPVLAKTAVLVLSLIVAGGIFYFSSAGKPLLEIVQQPLAQMPSSGKDIAVLPLDKEVVFDTLKPTLINIGPDSWISLEGKANLYKSQQGFFLHLSQGRLYFVAGPEFSLKKVVKIGDLKITALNTEFFIQTGQVNTEIQLLSGKLVVEYQQERGLGAVSLFSGQGLKASSRLQPQIEVYKLSGVQKQGLTVQIKAIKEASLWFQSHPSQTRFKSGDLRIEYWKEG